MPIPPPTVANSAWTTTDRRCLFCRSRLWDVFQEGSSSARFSPCRHVSTKSCVNIRVFLTFHISDVIGHWSGVGRRRTFIIPQTKRNDATNQYVKCKTTQHKRINNHFYLTPHGPVVGENSKILTILFLNILVNKLVLSVYY